MITSAQNENIRYVRTLISSRKARRNSGKFILEGIRLIEEAVESGWIPEKVLFSDELNQRGRTIIDHLPIPNENILEVKSSLLADLSDTETSQGILSILKYTLPILPQITRFCADPG